MSKWKEAFLRSLDPERETEESYQFGPAVTASALDKLEASVNAKIPSDVRELLSEFNGVKTTEGETFFFSTHEMPTAIEYYRNWDWPTDLLLASSKNILYLCQENGFASMWGVVVKPFANFSYGQVIAFDHDEITYAESAEELFAVPYPNLLQLVEANYKASTA